mmetsp:Transcript_11447/g.16191  ORF Transcript_11447/g.16191 Transcript_11447/m.16191 type:complete len:175 (+) Transcript_11447:1242-1766(+)
MPINLMPTLVHEEEYEEEEINLDKNIEDVKDKENTVTEPNLITDPSTVDKDHIEDRSARNKGVQQLDPDDEGNTSSQSILEDSDLSLSKTSREDTHLSKDSHLSEETESEPWNFNLNPYDRCVANKYINGKQCTITWYVDNVKVSHVKQAVVYSIIDKMRKEYGDIKVQTGKHA